jgi:hypothetical protein
MFVMLFPVVSKMQFHWSVSGIVVRAFAQELVKNAMFRRTLNG